MVVVMLLGPPLFTAADGVTRSLNIIYDATVPDQDQVKIDLDTGALTFHVSLPVASANAVL